MVVGIAMLYGLEWWVIKKMICSKIESVRNENIDLDDGNMQGDRIRYLSICMKFRGCMCKGCI